MQPSTNTSAHTFVSATADGIIKQDNKITINVTAAKALDQYVHTFVGPGTEAVIVGGDYGHKFIGIAQSAVVSGGAYNHTFVSATTGGVTIVGIGTTTPSDVTYDADTGEMVMTIDGVGSGTTVGLGVSFATNAISFTCSMDGFASTHSYPRATDPVVGFGSTAITALTGNTVTINVGSLLLGGLLELLPLACLLEGLGLGVRCVRLDAGVRLVPVTVAVHHRAVPARRGGGGGPRPGGGAAGGGRGGAGGGGDRSGGGGGHRWLLLLLLLWQGRDSGP